MGLDLIGDYTPYELLIRHVRVIPGMVASEARRLGLLYWYARLNFECWRPMGDHSYHYFSLGNPNKPSSLE